MKLEQEDLYDVIVIGGGPAGLTAALYLARARYRVLVVEKERLGGQITLTAEVLNYPGVERTSGSALGESMSRQARNFGAEVLLAEAERLDLRDMIKTVTTSRGVFRAFGVLLATGAQPRRIGFEGEEAFKGRGVAYCATCDGEFFTGGELIVVGGGFAAAEESLFLTRYARHITVLIRNADFSCPSSIAEATRAHEKITVLAHSELEAVGGGKTLEYARWRNTQTGERTEFRPQVGSPLGVFVFAGYEPATTLVRDLGILNDQGYVITDENQQTAVSGLYAAGDGCVKPLRQVVTAVGDGAKAAVALEKYAQTLREQLGLRPVPPVSRLPRKGEAEDEGNIGEKTPTGTERFLTPEMRRELTGVFERMARPLVLHLALDERGVSGELKRFMEELSALTDKLSLRLVPPAASETEAPWSHRHLPAVGIYLEDGAYRGMAFHGVPSGHEFNAFVIALYNAAGPGQALETDLQSQIQRITKPVSLKVFVSLTCTLCPDMVMAAQRIAAENPCITAEVYDLAHFLSLREQYQVMSVPCLLINERTVHFGKKSIRELLSLLSESA
ncbi:MAG: FAD-dependent oxidoreductase [Spirochaetaceae bacterium]|jgi:thioredoxin reductase (NADPH)|nr:FAD-dependent oxidoreductase [Spirochaetaceae bacterium]